MSGQTIEWGALITLPNGAPDVEQYSGRSHAMSAASNINHRSAGAAKLVYRTVEHGPWMVGAVGDEWGMQESWTDGHVEVHPTSTRRESEIRVRGSSLDTARVVVSRTVQVGDWWLAEVLA